MCANKNGINGVTSNGKNHRKNPVSQHVDHRDSCYSWWVAVCAFLANVICASHVTSASLYLVEWAETYQVSRATIGWIASIQAFLTAFMGMFAGGMIDRFGGRIVCIVGTLIQCTGLFLSSLATSIEYLYITYGVITGMGIGITFLVPLVIVPQYFRKHQNISSGLSLMGFSTGAFAFVPFLRAGIVHYSWRGALLLQSGACLQNLVLSFYFVSYDQRYGIDKTIQPNTEELLAKKEKIQPKVEKQQSEKEKVHFEIEKVHPEFEEQKQLKPEKHLTEKETKPPDKGCKNFFKEYLKSYDLSIFKDICFILTSCFTCFCVIGLEVFYKGTPSRGISVGLTKEEASYIPFTTALASTIARIPASFIANMQCTNILLQMSINVILGGILIVVFVLVTDFLPIIILTAIYGFTVGLAHTVGITISVELFGLERLGVVQSWFTLFRSVFLLVIIPLVGLVYDITGSYDLAYIICGCIQILGGLLLGLATYIHYKRLKEKQQDSIIPDNEEHFIGQHAVKPKSHVSRIRRNTDNISEIYESTGSLAIA